MWIFFYLNHIFFRLKNYCFEWWTWNDLASVWELQILLSGSRCLLFSASLIIINTHSCMDSVVCISLIRIITKANCIFFYCIFFYITCRISAESHRVGYFPYLLASFCGLLAEQAVELLIFFVCVFSNFLMLRGDQ